MSISLMQLRAFVAVADTAGFVSGAELLGISQSAISHTIANFESEIGSELFTRRPRVTTTALGKQILPQARAALAAVDAIESNLSERTASSSGFVRLALARTVSFGLLPELMQLWRSNYPSIRVQIFEGDDDELLSWLETGMVDAAILMNPARIHPSAVVLGTDHYAAVLRRDHPLAEEELISPSDLSDDPMLLSDSGCAPYVDRIMRAANPNFYPKSVVRDAGALLSMVASGVGVCLLPSAGQPMLPSTLVMVPLEPTESRVLVFSGPSNREWLPAVRSLAGVCAEHPVHLPELKPSRG